MELQQRQLGIFETHIFQVCLKTHVLEWTKSWLIVLLVLLIISK